MLSPEYLGNTEINTSSEILNPENHDIMFDL